MSRLALGPSNPSIGFCRKTAIPIDRLVIERSLSIGTAAAVGNASLMTLS
jgi:delta 1-pyrroline-5-carboxylate dehydrogenase